MSRVARLNVRDQEGDLMAITAQYSDLLPWPWHSTCSSTSGTSGTSGTAGPVMK